MKSFLAIAFFSSTLAAFADEAVVIPVPHTDRLGGNTAVATPFFSPASTRYQQVYHTSEFDDINQGGGWITELAFRFEGRIFYTWSPSVQINLSTTARMPDGLSTTFAENVGADDQVIYGPGSLWIEGVVESPRGFPDVIQLDEPFLYDPAQGNLLMDVRVNEDFSVDGFGPFVMDASEVYGDSVSAVSAFGFGSPTGLHVWLGNRICRHPGPGTWRDHTVHCRSAGCLFRPASTASTPKDLKRYEIRSRHSALQLKLRYLSGRIGSDSGAVCGSAWREHSD